MIIRDTLKQLKALTEIVHQKEEIASELLRIAQDRYNDRVHKLTRQVPVGLDEQGKAKVELREVELTEKVLWGEVWYRAEDSTKLMREVHPEVFAAFDAQNQAADDLKRYALIELGIDPTKMTLSAYLEATEKLVEIMLAERGIATKSPVQLDTPENNG